MGDFSKQPIFTGEKKPDGCTVPGLISQPPADPAEKWMAAPKTWSFSHGFFPMPWGFLSLSLCPYKLLKFMDS
jgi:hypothetical protein